MKSHRFFSVWVWDCPWGLDRVYRDIKCDFWEQGRILLCLMNEMDEISCHSPSALTWLDWVFFPRKSWAEWSAQLLQVLCGQDWHSRVTGTAGSLSLLQCQEHAAQAASPQEPLFTVPEPKFTLDLVSKTKSHMALIHGRASLFFSRWVWKSRWFSWDYSSN